MNTDEGPVIKLCYEDFLEKKIKDLHVDNTRLEGEVQTLREANRASKDRPMIHLLRANGDLLPEAEGDTITFELEYTGENNALGSARLTVSLKFARRTDVTESQAQPVIDEFVQDVREWIAETFKLEPVA